MPCFRPLLLVSLLAPGLLSSETGPRPGRPEARGAIQGGPDDPVPFDLDQWIRDLSPDGGVPEELLAQKEKARDEFERREAETGIRKAREAWRGGGLKDRLGKRYRVSLSISLPEFDFDKEAYFITIPLELLSVPRQTGAKASPSKQLRLHADAESLKAASPLIQSATFALSKGAPEPGDGAWPPKGDLIATLKPGSIEKARGLRQLCREGIVLEIVFTVHPELQAGPPPTSAPASMDGFRWVIVAGSLREIAFFPQGSKDPILRAVAPSAAVAGPFKGRLADKAALAARGGGGPDTEDAVLAALKWLARHQNADGSWKTQAYVGECNKASKLQGGKCSPNPGYDDFDAGNTALSVLAFLGAGYSHLSKDTHDGICFGDVVRKGLQWMMSRQDPDGCIGSRNAMKYLYNHVLCVLAMAEACGLTGSDLFKGRAQKGVDFLVAAQNPGKGWRYAYKCGDNDSSVTGWAVLALKAAEISKLSFPLKACEGARAWFDEATEGGFGRVGYTHKGTGKVFVPGLNENYGHHETLTAIGVMARIFMDGNKVDARLAGSCDLLLRDKPKWDGTLVDYYYWHHASQALFHYDGPSGPKWKAWNKDMKGALVNNQNPGSAGCKAGSWEAVDRWSGEGGRVYGTAINALTLEVYYRYPAPR